MATAQQQLYAAIARYAPSVDHLARTRYGISGAALLAKVIQGESGGWADPGASLGKVSSAGARGTGQFMPGSRRIAIEKFGVDPWRSITEAVHGTALHLRGLINGGSGVAAYNAGDPGYTDYILGQHVGDVGKAIGLRGGVTGAQGASAPTGGAGAVMSGLGDVPSFQQTLSLRTAPPPIQATLPPPPSFAAGPPMPVGYPGVPMSGGPAPVPDFSLPDPTQAALPAMAPVGAVDQPRDPGGSSTAGTPLHPGGGYAGTQGLARHAKFQAAKAGWRVTSEKRFTKSTATGGTSDHWVGSKNAWADDFSNGSTTVNADGIALAKAIAARYGVTFALDSYDSGGTIRVGDHRFRIQILYGAKVDHSDHIHVGIKRVS